MTPVARAACGPGVEFMGFSDALDKARFDGTRVGGLSGLTYDPTKSVYYAVVDNDGETQSRFYTLEIPLTSLGLGTPRILASTVLRTGAGAPFTGSNFDGEAIRLFKGTELLISSETEPSLRRFSIHGDFVYELPLPVEFHVSPAGYSSINEGLESVAVNNSGSRVLTAPERHLEIDEEMADGRSRIRILHFGPRDWGFEAEAHNYYLTEPGQSVSDMVFLSDDELLVMERGFVARQGNLIRIFRVSLTGVQEVSQEFTLQAEHLMPMPKTLLLDLASCPSGGARNAAPQPNPLLDNFEAMALGPVLPDGRTLLLLSDDNFNPTQVTRVIALLLR